MSIEINKLRIRNIKGFSDKEIDLGNLHPNKVGILVAPNGFGKSSIAAALDSLKVTTRIDVEKKNLHNENENLIPELSMDITIDRTKETLIANNNKNDIKKKFDVFVINSSLLAKANNRKIAGVSVPSPTMEVKPVVLIEKVPEYTKWDYKFTTYRTKFKFSKIINLSNPDCHFIKELNRVNFEIFSKTKTNNTFQEILSKPHFDFNQLTELVVPKDFLVLLEIIERYCSSDDKQVLFYTALEIIDLYKSDKIKFKKFIDYNEYLVQKEFYMDFFSNIDQTWKNVLPVEEKTKQKQKRLVVNFPQTQLISNGQRDFLVFLSELLAISGKIKKDNVIILIDEVFDYLDESNLIVAQYFISNFLANNKKTKNVFAILLTHLDPSFFNHYCFIKPQIIHLLKSDLIRDENIEKIFLSRTTIKNNDIQFSEAMNRYFLHHCPFSEWELDIAKIEYFKQKFSENNFSENYNSPAKIKKAAINALEKYLLENKKNPILICLGVRLVVEEICYLSIQLDKEKEKFIETHRTNNKLDYCDEIGLEYPETFRLLGLLYNDIMHIDEKTLKNKLNRISLKLDNLIIKKMMENVYKYYKKLFPS